MKREANLNTAFVPPKKLSNFLIKNKDSIPLLEKQGIYNVPCECGHSYIGQTKRNIGTRLKEHKRLLTANYSYCPSALVEHAVNEDHEILWAETTILAQPTTQTARNTRESLEIFKTRNTILNREAGPRNISIWKSLFNGTR